MNTDTPETDSAYIQRPNEGAWDFRVRQEKTMEKLERERDKAREELATVTAERIHGGAGAGKPRGASTPLDDASC